MAFLHGYGLGLTLIILIGPVLFTLLQATLKGGFKSGWAVAWGIFVSDIVCVLLCSFSTRTIFENPHNLFYIGIMGGIILLGFGLLYLLKPPLQFDVELKLKATDYMGLFIKGFLINFVNPVVFGVWIGFIALGTDTYGFNMQLGWFLTGMLLAILTTDTIKAALAHYIKRFLKEDLMRKLYLIIGGLLVICGIAMFYIVFDQYT